MRIRISIYLLLLYYVHTSISSLSTGASHKKNIIFNFLFLDQFYENVNSLNLIMRRDDFRRAELLLTYSI